MTHNPVLDAGELYRVLAENATDAIVTIDAESVILSVNPAGERLFGYGAPELLGTSLTRLMPEAYRTRHRAGMARYLETGTRHIPWQAVRLPILTRDGRELPVEISFGEFVSDGQRIFSAILRDLSERLAAEAALAASAEQLQGQAIELEQQIEEAQAIGEELEQTNEELRFANAELGQARIVADASALRTRQLQGLTASLARARTMDEIAAVVVREAVHATGAATGMLALRDASTNEAVMLEETGLPGSLKADYARFPISRDSPTAECLRTNAPIFLRQREGPDGLLARYPALRGVWDSVGRSALATVPLRVGDEAIAAMSFTFAEPQAFDDDDQDFFFTLAAQGAQAIARIRAFEAERRERQRSESIVEAITDGFATVDTQLRMTYVNTRAAAMFGVARDALTGRDITTLPGASDSPFVHLLRKVIAERRSHELEAYGTITGRWLAMRAYPADDGGVIVYFQDITDRRRQQEASSFLAEASRLLVSSRSQETTLKHLAQAVIPRLGDWCAVDLVERFSGKDAADLRRVEILHHDPDKAVIVEEYRRLYPPDARDGFWGAVTSALDGESVVLPVVSDDMLVAGTRDARHLALIRALGVSSVMIIPLVVADRVLGTLTLCAATTGRRFDDVDRRLAEDLAGRAANAVEHARLLEEAEAANAAKSEFLRTVSHELRQPLNAIAGLLQLWELGIRGTLTPQQHEDLSRIKRNQHQLTMLIEDLLSFARLEAGKLDVRRETVRLAPVLEGLASALPLDLDAQQVRYASEVLDPTLTVIGDADRLHQVLVNLVTNAIRATPPGGQIDVSCVELSGTVQLRVRDTGIGIPAAMLESIFRPFIQVGRALNQPKDGVGLGLAISRGLVEAMGGTLTAESEVGLGSTFAVTLPIGASDWPLERAST
ncbi:MAG: PAS domain S-box protein [Gemmatimonadaceae bacterium]